MPCIVRSHRHCRTRALLVLVLLLAGCGATEDRDQADGPPPLLLISIDGFRHDYMELARLPALERLSEGGMKADSLQHVFPTKTFTTHYSLVTGLYAENTGVVANSMWDPERRARFSRRERDSVSDGYWYDGEPIWNTVEKAGRIAATYFWPGSEAPIGGMRPTHFKFYDGSVTHDQRIDQVLAWLDLPAERRPSFLTLYFSAVDSAGHAHGPGHPKTLDAAREVDRALGRLLDELEQRGLLERMHILVTSDHGMQQIDLDRYVMLDEFIDLSQVRVSDWGPATQIWTIDDGPNADVLVAALIERHPAFARVWKKGEAPPRYHFDDHQRVPDVTVEAELGWMISNRPYYAGMQRGALNGMHGWDPAWHNMHGVLIAHGPAFEAGERLPAVRSVDLYSLMATLLEIEPAETDGSLTAFRAMLASDTPLRPMEQRWRCDDGQSFMTRTVPGLAALHDGARVFALPAAEAASGSRFADTGVEFWSQGDSARFEIEGESHTGCQLEAGG